MQVRAKKFVLLAAMDRTFGVTSKSEALPVLQAVKVTAESGSLSMVGSDTELTMVSTVHQVEVLEPGEALFPPRAHDIIKACPDAEITVTVKENVATIECEAATWTILLERDEYPELSLEHTPLVRVPKDGLASALRATMAAINSDAIRENFQFIQTLAPSDDSPSVMRATDGNKLLHNITDFELFNALIPSRAITEINRRLRAMALDEVEIGSNDRTMTFKFDKDVLIVTKQTVEYPDVDSVMLAPTASYEDELQVDRTSIRKL